MNTKSVKRTKFWITVVAVVILLQILLTGITLAWFTDQKSSSATLKFGTIELDDTGSNATGLAVSIARGETTLTSEEAIMPGDKVDININVKLKTTSQPAYYLVYLDHDELFGDKEFFFKKVTKTAATDETSERVYATDGTKIYTVSETGTIDAGTESTEVAGKISGGETHTLAFSLTIDETATSPSGDKEISCTVYAIQQANLTAKQAYDEMAKCVKEKVVTFGTGAVVKRENGELTEVSSIPSWQQAITDFYTYQTIGFYKTGEQPTGLTENAALTNALNAKQAENNLETGKIRVFTNGTAKTHLAFVSKYKIMAPENSCGLFSALGSLSGETSGDEIDETANYTMEFNNFYTDNVTDMSCMFFFNGALNKDLDLSSWKTTNVTDMSYMFCGCARLVEINMAGLDTSKVTNMSCMFSSVLGEMALTKINLSGWNTSSVTEMSGMFLGCRLLTELDLSSFDISNLTVEDIEKSNMFEKAFLESTGEKKLIVGDNFKYTYDGDVYFLTREDYSQLGLISDVVVVKNSVALS